MSSEKLIANELLAFLQHAIDTMDEVSILQICKSNFKEEEICKSKVLLYETLGQADRMPTRRRDVKGERSLQDMINLLKSTDPDDVPAFVAKELHKLPPVTFDHVDVTRLLKDITTLKADLAEVPLLPPNGKLKFPTKIEEVFDDNVSPDVLFRTVTGEGGQRALVKILLLKAGKHSPALAATVMMPPTDPMMIPVDKMQSSGFGDENPRSGPGPDF